MTTREMTVKLPKEILRDFDRVATEQGQAPDSLLTQLIREYVKHSDQQRQIARQTLAALGIKPNGTKRKRSINTRKVAQAMKKTFGTADVVEIVDKSRDRWGSDK